MRNGRSDLAMEMLERRVNSWGSALPGIAAQLFTTRKKPDAFKRVPTRVIADQIKSERTIASSRVETSNMDASIATSPYTLGSLIPTELPSTATASKIAVRTGSGVLLSIHFTAI